MDPLYLFDVFQATAAIVLLGLVLLLFLVFWGSFRK